MSIQLKPGSTIPYYCTGEDIANYLKERNEKSSLSELGNLVGVSRQIIHHIANKKIMPNDKLLDVLGLEKVIVYVPKNTKI